MEAKKRIIQSKADKISEEALKVPMAKDTANKVTKANRKIAFKA